MTSMISPAFALAVHPQPSRAGQHSSFRNSRSEFHCLVNVSLLDHFLRFIISGLLIHVFLHVALNLCTRLQLCSTAQSSRSDLSLAGSSSGSVPAVPRQSSEPAGRSSHPVGGHLLRYHVCLRTGVLECFDDASLHLDFTFVSLVSGHPRPPRCNGLSVPWVSLPGPTGVPPMPRQDGIGSRAPTLVVAL